MCPWSGTCLHPFNSFGWGELRANRIHSNRSPVWLDDRTTTNDLQHHVISGASGRARDWGKGRGARRRRWWKIRLETYFFSCSDGRHQLSKWFARYTAAVMIINLWGIFRILIKIFASIGNGQLIRFSNIFQWDCSMNANSYHSFAAYGLWREAHSQWPPKSVSIESKIFAIGVAFFFLSFYERQWNVSLLFVIIVQNHRWHLRDGWIGVNAIGKLAVNLTSKIVKWKRINLWCIILLNRWWVGEHWAVICGLNDLPMAALLGLLFWHRILQWNGIW